MTEHHTAWVTTDTTCLDQDCVDVAVLKDELRGEPDDPNAWFSTGDPLFHALTDTNARGGDHETALTESETLLADGGWRIAGTWEGVPTGYVATVERA